MNWALRSSPIVSEWWEKQDIRGQGISIALLGTGVLPTHPDLQGAIKGAFSFDGSDITENPTNIGTQAALMVAARGYYSYGIAPEANLLIGKIGRNEREIRAAGLLAGLSWALDNGADIVAMLLDFRELSSSESAAMEDMIQTARSRKVLLMAPVGNATGPKPETRFPAALNGVLCVGVHDSNSQHSTFSARSYHLDVLAPGEDLTLPEPNGDYRLNLRDTALATAFMAGVAALIKADFSRRGKIFDPAEIVGLLRDTAIPHKNITKGSDVEYGHGIFSADNLLQVLRHE